jgi:hypothetical protein
MPGLASVPSLGPVGAPQYNQPTPLVELGAAVGQFPAQQRQAQSENLGIQEQQQQLDTQQFQMASQRLSVLNKMIAQNPAIGSSPDIVSAYQRAFKAMGMDAPLTPGQDGKQGIDAQAVGAFAPLHDFIAQNLPMLLQTEPKDRAGLIQSATGQPVPPEIADQLAKIPRKYLQSPAEAGSLLNYVKTSVGGLNKPGGSIDNVIATIQAVSKPLADAGIDANVLIDGLKPDLYAQAMQQAQLALIQAKTKDEVAKAQVALKMLPERISAIHSLNDLHSVMAEYYPQMAAAAGQRAGADASRAASDAAQVGAKIDKLKADTAKDYADADAAHQRALTLHQTLSNTVSGHVPPSVLSTLQRAAHEAQARYDSLNKAYQQSLLDAQTYKGQPYGAQAQAAADGYKRAMDDAAKDVGSASSLYQRAIGSPGAPNAPKVPERHTDPSTGFVWEQQPDGKWKRIQ